MKKWFVGLMLFSWPLWAIVGIPPVGDIAPGEKQILVGVNEFLYVDQFSAWDVGEVGFRYGVTERLAVGVRSWRLGLLGGISYCFIGDRNNWFRLGGFVEGGYGYHPEKKNWVSTYEPALVFDVSLARPVRVYLSTGWRKFSSEEYLRWRVSTGLWIRWRSVVFVPEVSVVRFAQFDPSLPPFYLNPAFSCGVSF